MHHFFKKIVEYASVWSVDPVRIEVYAETKKAWALARVWKNTWGYNMVYPQIIDPHSGKFKHDEILNMTSFLSVFIVPLSHFHLKQQTVHLRISPWNHSQADLGGVFWITQLRHIQQGVQGPQKRTLVKS